LENADAEKTLTEWGVWLRGIKTPEPSACLRRDSDIEPAVEQRADPNEFFRKVDRAIGFLSKERRQIVYYVYFMRWDFAKTSTRIFDPVTGKRMHRTTIEEWHDYMLSDFCYYYDLVLRCEL